MIRVEDNGIGMEQEQAEKLKSGEITQEEYDQWRYNYPKNDK